MIAIIVNTSPFITSILAFFVNKEEVSKLTILCLIGCFSGIVILSLAKKKETELEEAANENNSVEDLSSIELA